MRRPGPQERDTCRDFVVPALEASGWQSEQVVEQFPVAAQRVATLGGVTRELGSGFVDYVLEAAPGLMTAVVEAKREYRDATDGLQQALRYAQQLDVPLAYATNGVEIIEHNLRTGGERRVSEFAAPAVAWDEYQQLHGLQAADAALVRQPLNRGRRNAAGEVITPRYYQAVAINRALAAIARGDRRVLLLMATGTGKTFTAMQIVAKLRAYEAAVRPQRNYRVLYLADRDQLLSQPMRKDFTPAFGGELLNRVRGGVDTSREIYFATYQALAAGGDRDSLFEAFRPDFFDLVIVDECHRGSAEENSAWRAVLDYFADAVQLGLTATPRSDRVNSYDYFGNPVYRYTLRQGIEDGFLAPYRVRRVMLSPDAEGWVPAPGLLDRLGREVPEGVYSTRDFERVVALLARTQLAARHLSGILRRDPTARCIVFCVDTEHAARMRQALVNENADLCQENERYVMRITGNDAEGCAELGNFIDPESKYPVIVTTSRLLSTGVDAQTCRLIVLDRPVGSMTEFKQIVGRGTRVHEDTKKYYFTIIDFRGASGHFADPDFDGEPVQIYEPPDGGPIVPPDGPPEGGGEGPNPPEPGDDETVIVDYPEPPDITIPPDGEKRYKIYVDGVSANIIAERVEYLDEYGKLVTESLRDFTKKALKKRFASLDDFLQLWNEAERKQAIVEELAAEGLPLGPLAEEVGKNLDPFDLICHVAFDRPPLTRRERAENVRKRDVFSKYGPQARAVLDALLLKYQDDGVLDLDDPRILQVSPFDAMGTPVQLIKQFGTRSDFEEAVHELQDALYQEVV